MNNLSCLYRDQGQYAKAELIFVDCLSKKEVVLGADHPDTIDTRNSLKLNQILKKKESESKKRR